MIVNSANLTLFFRGAQTIFNKAFTGFQSQWQQVATLVPSNTSEEDYGWLGSWPRLREWVGDRQVMNLTAYDYTIKNKKFESTVAVLKDNLDDDKFGVYNPMFQALAEAGAEHPDELVFNMLDKGIVTPCYDGQYFFDVDHPVAGVSVANVDKAGAGNYWYTLDTRKALKPLVFQRRRDYSLRSIQDLNDERVFMTDEFLFGVDARANVGFGFWQMAYASNQALDGTNFGATESAMLAFKDDNGRPLNVRPNIVVVGPSNVAAARATFLVDRLANGASNPYFNAVKILTVPWLA